MKRVVLFFLLSIFSNAALAAEPPTCLPREGFETRALGGEIGGDHDYREELGNGWSFVLVRETHGWTITLVDPTGRDLTLDTAPVRTEPNPRQIFGWHFRNADNTATNDGSVNAPQHLRLFTISTFPPAASQEMPATSRFEGRGALTIIDYGLADLEPGMQARMVYLKFHVCLVWPSAAVVSGPFVVAEEDVERFGACGLAAPLALEPYLSPYKFEGDFDGDGAFDVAATIIRSTDGKRGIAVCRAGTWLALLGLEGDMGELTPEYFDGMDYWGYAVKGPVSESPFADGAVPIPSGDTLTLGMEEKSSVLLYWDGTRFQSYWQGD